MVALNENSALKKPECAPKNRVGFFFGEAAKSRPVNRLPAQQPCGEKADGSIAAHYEYGPFGELLVEYNSTGLGTAVASFRFSTKYFDAELKTYYYGFRYYDPTTGRCLNRDPIEESGGLNLYGFVGNNAVCFFDVLGEKSFSANQPTKVGATRNAQFVVEVFYKQQTNAEFIKETYRVVAIGAGLTFFASQSTYGLTSGPKGTAIQALAQFSSDLTVDVIAVGAKCPDGIDAANSWLKLAYISVRDRDVMMRIQGVELRVTAEWEVYTKFLFWGYWKKENKYYLYMNKVNYPVADLHFVKAVEAARKHFKL